MVRDPCTAGLAGLTSCPLATYVVRQLLWRWVAQPLYRLGLGVLFVGLLLFAAGFFMFFVGSGFYGIYLGVGAIGGQPWWVALIYCGGVATGRGGRCVRDRCHRGTVVDGDSSSGALAT